MFHRKPVFWAPVVFGLLLFFAAWHLRLLTRSVADDVVVFVLGILTICVAVWYYRSADMLGLMMEQRERKRTLTARWFASHIRWIGALGAVLGVLFVWLGATILLKRL